MEKATLYRPSTRPSLSAIFLGLIATPFLRAQAPGRNASNAAAAGRTVNGEYSGQGGVALKFDSASASAVVTCGELAPATRNYTIQRTGNQVAMKIQNDQRPILLTFGPDDKLNPSAVAGLIGLRLRVCA